MENLKYENIMASRRKLKKDIDYLIGAVISNCDACLYFSPKDKWDKIMEIVEEAVDVRNALFARMRPAEKDNASLVRKHYAALRSDMFTQIDGLFEKLSEACK